MGVIGQKWLYSGTVVVVKQSGCVKVCVRAKWLCLGKSGCIRAQWLYSGKVEQSGCVWAKVVVFGQSGCIWAKAVCILAKCLY